MTENQYIIRYQSITSVAKPSRGAMAAYLEREKAVWSPILEALKSLGTGISINAWHDTITAARLADGFTVLEETLDADPSKFGVTSSHGMRQSYVVPPPSLSTEGRLIIGLYHSLRSNDAVAAYVRYALNELAPNRLQQPLQGDTAKLEQRGYLLLAAAHAAAALPQQKLEASGLKSLKKEARDAISALEEKISEASSLNEDHRQHLNSYRAEALQSREHFVRRARRLAAFFVRAEWRRRQGFKHWCAARDQAIEDRFADADRRMNILDKRVAKENSRREKEFDDLKQLFHTQLRLRAPVALWESRAESHNKQASSALLRFWIAAAAAILLGILAPFFFGDYIANSFTQQQCAPGTSEGCVATFSAKGPLTVGGLLLTTSLLLWVVRMQYRIFLSERHLSLDASEKKAFAETFMAMRQDASVDVANETIVLTSLFRPTQDGIIKDEGGSGLDFSAAALLAKQMSKP